MDKPSVTTFVEKLLSDPEVGPFIAHHEILPARAGTLVDFPKELFAPIANGLRARGIKSLYSHQAECWNLARSGKNVVVVTPTASGKTLCYNLPVIQDLLENKTARALYLFPTKALSQDQQSELNEFLAAADPDGNLGIRVNTYDGDTPNSLRIAARDSGRIVISNPDMLHSGILPNHPKWNKFFERLSYVVIDEMHGYRGVFGSHVANVIRRLKRIASFYGSKPVFILCSATIGNPGELAKMLLEDEVSLVSINGAPRGEKNVLFYNPPLVDPVQGIRKSVTNESQKLALKCLYQGVKTILFARSRVRTEVIASYINQSLANIYTDNARIRVEPYRGGFLPNERREIEKGLRNGDIQGVVSTNALELGIDIGGLDASVIAGFPGSFASFWQQAGRSGRRASSSVAIFVASSSPLDQYIIRHPEYFFSRPPERALLDADNPYILTDHVKCATFELPFSEGDEYGSELKEVLGLLEEEGVVRLTGGKWYWSDRSYPSERISLRSATADNIVIVDITQGRNTVIGEMDRPSAKELIFDDAVYIHHGRQYVVKKLDIDDKRCAVEESEANYFTDAVVKTDIKVLTEDERIDLSGLSCVVGDVLVRSQVAKYKKIRFHSHENIGYGDVSQAEEEMQTRSAVLLFGSESPASHALDEFSGSIKAAALSGLGQLIREILPIYLLCDSRDIGIAERVRDPHFGCPALYIYDMYPGGTGLAESAVSRMGELLLASQEALDRCPCADGCPSCIGANDDLGSGKASQGEIKNATERLLTALTGVSEP